MKKITYILLFSLAMALSACTISETESETIQEKVTNNPISDKDSAAAMEPDMDTVEKKNAMHLRSEISDYRLKIENTADQLEKKELDLSVARAEVSQDWNKLEYFLSDDEVVKIKTYPSEEGKNKTEEFYFLDNQLVFALIEDDLNRSEAANEESSDKAYYFSEGQLIVSESYEITETSEEEKDEILQGSKLQDEAREYLKLVYESRDK